MHRHVALASLAAFALSLNVVPASHASYSLRTEWFMQNTTTNPSGAGADSGNLSVAGPIYASHALSGTAGDGAAASISVDISSNYGRLTASATGSSNNSDTNGTIATVGGYFGGDPLASYHDHLTIVSNSLAKGTPVVMNLTQALAATASHFPGNTSGFYSSDIEIRTVLTIYESGRNQTITLGPTDASGFFQQTANFATYVGDQVDLDGRLYLAGTCETADAGFQHASISGDATATTAITLSLPAAEPASALAPTFAPDLSYVADSGMSYPVSVPEPASATVVVAAMLLAPRRRR